MTLPLTIGMISGTSLDGIDVAICHIDGHAQQAAIELVAFDTVPYAPAVREELLNLYEDATNAIARICSMNVVIGQAFAHAAVQALEANGLSADDVVLAGSHGQTVWHQPEGDSDLIVPSTLQVGEASVIAAALNCAVVSDFRVADMAVGGQGAPLAAYLDWAAFGDAHLNRAVQNIGGIGNVTWVPANGSMTEVIAFDTGPGNMMIDALVSRLTNGEQTYDTDGAIGSNGTVDYELLNRLMQDPYLAIAPPKTTGREYYGSAMVDTILRDRTLNADVIATVTAFTAHSIADSYRQWLPELPDEVYVNGGGARNPLLMRMLADALDGIPVRATDELGITADGKEAVCFALMAHDAIAGYPTNIPGATGAQRAVALGKVTRL
jgi:anhydro-N-acetylmuramic acid kinase